MPSEQSSPSGGWRSVYAEMGVGAAVEDRRRIRRHCRECGRPIPPRTGRDGSSEPHCPRHRRERRDDGRTPVDRDDTQRGDAGDDGDDADGDADPDDRNDAESDRQTRIGVGAG